MNYTDKMSYTEREKTWIKFLYESTKGCKNDSWRLKNKPFFLYAKKPFKILFNENTDELTDCMNWASDGQIWGVYETLVDTYNCNVITYVDKFGNYQVDWKRSKINVNVPKIRKLYKEIFCTNSDSNALKEIFNDNKVITVKLLKKCDLAKTESDTKTDSKTISDNVIKENKKRGRPAKFCATELIKFFDVGYRTSLVVTDIMNYLGCSDETARKLRYDLIKEGYIKELGYCQENKSKKLYEILKVPA